MRDFSESVGLSDALLDWYDVHARSLPWRAPPGSGFRTDPYKVWMSEVMLQQTTVAAVKTYFETFTRTWPTVSDLAAAKDEDVMAAWAGLGYYARARNLLKCARVVAQDHGGVFPTERDELLKLPGIGPYTASAIAAIAFDRPETVVDGNVERVMARLFAVETPLPTAKKQLTDLAEGLTPEERPGDYAQAVMDLGATICSPKSPACGICPWGDPCAARVQGIAAELPRKLPKKEKPTRLGVAFVGRRADGAWLLEQRPPEGLLGGMLGWPGSDWIEGVTPNPAPPVVADWETLRAEARHTFTHFHLRVEVRVAHLPMESTPTRGQFMAADAFSPDHLPTAMRKILRIAAPWFESKGSL
ncbi:MAG: A/G-specific adenine glycosylase [Pseudomonadota bacterium]